LHQVTDFLEWEIQKKTAGQIVNSASRRKVVPGRYKTELKEETIRRLNHEFADILDRLGYQ
jgi:hypothetical protein